MYRIRQYDSADSEELKDQVIAPHQRRPEEYTLSLDGENVHSYVATDNGKLVGVMALDVRPLSSVPEKCTVIETDISPYLKVEPQRPVGFLRTGYTKPDYTGNGVGSALLTVVETVAKLNGLQNLLTEAWVHGGRDSPDKLLESSGFSPVELPDEVVEKDWVQNDAECVKCTGQCTCRAVLYEKLLD